MKQLMLFIIGFLLFLTSLDLAAQEMRLVKGTLRASDGEPLIGVNIIEKGTDHGTISDVDGNYSIVVPLGAELEYSFIGMNTQSKIVTYENSAEAPGYVPAKPVKKVVYKSSYTPVENLREPDSEDTTQTGTAYFSAGTKSYIIKNSYSIDSRYVSDINFEKESAIVSNYSNRYITIPYVCISSGFSSEQAIRLPATQFDYAQGRPLNGAFVWRGPETGEVFSWGPAISSLEYDGSDYTSSSFGRLVPIGSGNGQKVNTYHPEDFFVKGLQFKNMVSIGMKKENFFYDFSASHNYHSGIIPGSLATSELIEAKMGKTFRRILTIKSNLFFEKSRNSFMSGSPVTNLILFSVFTTPPTFDNSNGNSSSDAVKNSGSYMSEDIQRSSALYQANNPYWLLNNLREEDQRRLYNIAFSIKLQPIRSLTFSWNTSLQNQENNALLNYPENMWGAVMFHFLERNTNLQTLNSTEVLNYSKEIYNHDWYKSIEFETSLTHSLDYSENTLIRTEKNPENYDNYPLELNNSRRTNTLSWMLMFNLGKWFILRPVQSILFSGNNTYSSGPMYMPSLSGSINLDELFNLNCLLKIRSSWGYIVSEVPLTYNLGSYSVQDFSSESFTQSFFGHEVQPDFTLKPSRILKKGLGTDFCFFNNALQGTLDIYANNSKNEIFAVPENNTLVLKNMADYESRGIDFAICYRFSNYILSNGSIGFVYTRNTTKVIRLNDNREIVRLGGYSDIFTALIPGEPMGVLAGTAYQRNDKGQMIIGNDGYPLVDEELHVLGNPNPDFTVGLNGSISYRKFTFDMLVEYQHGGKIWNGTQNVLSYYGVSKESGHDRELKAYVFEGVTANGEINTRPVDFANPSASVETNRWVRYGVTGVAEDAIEDASNLRVSSIQLTRYSHIKRINFEVSVFAKNLLIIAEYKGSDPDAALWGNASAQGLDLFNCPLARSFGANLNIRF
jgi:hypothetical protein